jgi:hypothetical protein
MRKGRIVGTCSRWIVGGSRRQSGRARSQRHQMLRAVEALERPDDPRFRQLPRSVSVAVHRRVDFTICNYERSSDVRRDLHRDPHLRQSRTALKAS